LTLCTNSLQPLPLVRAEGTRHTTHARPGYAITARELFRPSCARRAQLQRGVRRHGGRAGRRETGRRHLLPLHSAVRHQDSLVAMSHRLDVITSSARAPLCAPARVHFRGTWPSEPRTPPPRTATLPAAPASHVLHVFSCAHARAAMVCLSGVSDDEQRRGFSTRVALAVHRANSLLTLGMRARARNCASLRVPRRTR